MGFKESRATSQEFKSPRNNRVIGETRRTIRHGFWVQELAEIGDVEAFLLVNEEVFKM